VVFVTKVVFITQQFDPERPLLAAAIPQVAALARRVDEVVVIADRVVASALPANARGYSFHSRTKLGRGVRLLAAIVRELPGLSAVIAHQCPVYAIIVAPVVRPARVPLVLWWSHSKIDRVVRLAERVCTKVVSVDASTFPMPSKKLVLIGQATDVASIPLRPAGSSRSDPPLHVLALARYGRIKGLSGIVRGAGVALERGVDLRLELHGPAPNAEAVADKEEIRRLVAELGIADRVSVGEAASTRKEVFALLGDADVLVSNTYGGADRVVYEAAASGIPVLASNPVHADVLDPDAFFERDDPDDLAGKLAAVAAMPAAGREAIGRRLRERVEQGHSVDSWAAGALAAAGLGKKAPGATSVDAAPGGVAGSR
jgi:glycosyltransferase involved in cell wall biosynthesis